ncbi:hypothetical protein BX266_0421 [Streptomyces sp. TLI_171]|nr:hypothetical protein BX266_0421 [Streptomyces sp. TLI_171]
MVVGLGVALGVVLGGGSGGGGGGGGGTQNVALQPVAAEGQAPFTGSVANAAAPASPSPRTSAPAAGGSASAPTAGSPSASGGTVNGGQPGLYGGTRDVASCDVPKLSAYLTGNSDKAKAWAGVEGIDSSQIDSYLHGLTPVVLRQDTRVTNHGFTNGQANPYQAVLQSGTAVLVDSQGVPRVRCACGNPLLPPNGTGGAYSGAAWSSFNPDGVVTVQPAPAPVTEIVLVDQTGHQFGRPVGGGGSDGSASPSASGSGSSSGKTGSGTPSGGSSSAPSSGKPSGGSSGPSGSPASPGPGSAPASPASPASPAGGAGGGSAGAGSP